MHHPPDDGPFPNDTVGRMLAAIPRELEGNVKERSTHPEQRSLTAISIEDRGHESLVAEVL